MTASPAKPAACIGFLCVVEQVEAGLVGGFLLLNPAGRPLEFHCTAPVKPSRTQEILYGPTLRSFLYGEHIGQTLLAKTRLAPTVVCVDCEALLAAREFTHVPMVRVLESQDGEAGFMLANHRVVAARHFGSDEHLIRAAWPAAAEHLDLREPFQRIREALDEAHRAARQAA